jgi:hypothetical protein
LALALQKIGTWFKRAQQERAAGQIVCFHCGERESASRAVAASFDGETRLVCCHGCAAILKTVESLGMQQQYLADKKRAGGSNEK